MARPLRVHIPGVTYHVMSRGNNKQTIFVDDADYQRYLEILERALKRFGVRCHAYCAMGNHVHLVVTPGEIPISRMMQQLNSTYCQSFNRRHKRVGHVLQGRFKSVMVDNDASFLRVVRYVTRNPVQAGLVELSGAWKWSSGPATLGLTRAPAFLDLSFVWKNFVSTDGVLAQQKIAEFLGHRDDDEIDAGSLTRSAEFVARLAPLLKASQANPDFTYSEKYAARPSLLQVLTDRIKARHVEQAAYEAFETHAYTLRQIAEVFKRSPATIWAWVQKGRPGRYPPTRLRLNQLLA
jgi:putative transposase